LAAYYNEIEPYPAQWLRNLIAEGLIADGDVDERGAMRPFLIWCLTCCAIVSMAFGFVMMLVVLAHAAPPPGIDPDSEISAWYQSLNEPGMAPGHSYGCCTRADCRPVAERIVDDKIQVFIDKKTFNSPSSQGDDRWHDVPPEKIIRGISNPTGEPIVCWYYDQVLCFVDTVRF